MTQRRAAQREDPRPEDEGAKLPSSSPLLIADGSLSHGQDGQEENLLPPSFQLDGSLTGAFILSKRAVCICPTFSAAIFNAASPRSNKFAGLNIEAPPRAQLQRN